MPPDIAAVAAKLRESLAAHQQALMARQNRDVEENLSQIGLAYRLRIDAHRLDPDHTAPTWQEDQRKTPRGRDTHQDFLRFYRQQRPDLIRELEQEQET